jgi:hypothetical protein
MEYTCEYCNKLYSSYQSRWIHIKKYHNNDGKSKVRESKGDGKGKSKEKVRKSKPENIDTKKYNCRFCNKCYSHKQTRYSHELKCKLEEKTIETNDTEDLKKEISELKDIIQKALKIHPKTLQKINNQLNNNNINNGTINYNIVQLGNENLEDILSSKEKMKILNKKGNSLKEIVELVHISNKYSQFKNVYITNLQNTIGYKFDSNNNKFIAVNKSDLLDDIIDCRMYDIQTFYNEMETSFDEEIKKIIKRFIDRMNDNDDNLKGIKKDEIKLLLYNSREKIHPTGKIDIEL